MKPNEPKINTNFVMPKSVQKPVMPPIQVTPIPKGAPKPIVNNPYAGNVVLPQKNPAPNLSVGIGKQEMTKPKPGDLFTGKKGSEYWRTWGFAPTENGGDPIPTYNKKKDKRS